MDIYIGDNATVNQGSNYHKSQESDYPDLGEKDRMRPTHNA